MFDLKVVGLHEAILLVQQNWPTRVISLTSDDSLCHYGLRHLHIQVDDAHQITPDWQYPLAAHLHQALAFSHDLDGSDRLLVHCFAGISRSTAIAIGILIAHGLSYSEAFDRVAAVRDILQPNQLFIQYIDEHFALSGALISHVAAHRRTLTDDPISGLLTAFKL